MLIRGIDTKQSPVVLFDGGCGLCHGFVTFVMKRDPQKIIRFASLSSEIGKELLIKFDLPTQDFKTVVVIDNGHCYTRSIAGLRVMKRLKGLWPATYSLAILPAFIRDAIYDYISSNRYQWFGTKDLSALKEGGNSQRFLN